MKVIVGLGNPGPKYADTRHNIGAMVIARLSSLWGIRLGRRSRQALIGQGSVGGEDVVLARPRSFMNQSGGPVAYLVNRLRIGVEDVLIIYDEMDLPLGVTRIRPDGSDGGHNGMRSIIEVLGTQDVPRMRLGVGRSPVADPISHVLGEFTQDERTQVDKLLDRAVEAVACFVAEGVNEAMNRFNQAPSDQDEESSDIEENGN